MTATDEAVRPVEAAYSEWHAGRRSEEPKLTAATVASLIDPALFEESPRLRERRRLLSRTRSALERARRARRLGSSLGWWHGREVRMYEPVTHRPLG